MQDSPCCSGVAAGGQPPAGGVGGARRRARGFELGGRAPVIRSSLVMPSSPQTPFRIRPNTLALPAWVSVLASPLRLGPGAAVAEEAASFLHGARPGKWLREGVTRQPEGGCPTVPVAVTLAAGSTALHPGQRVAPGPDLREAWPFPWPEGGVGLSPPSPPPRPPAPAPSVGSAGRRVWDLRVGDDAQWPLRCACRKAGGRVPGREARPSAVASQAANAPR